MEPRQAFRRRDSNHCRLMAAKDTMNRSTGIVAIVACLLLASTARCSDKDVTSPEALISRARLEEIWAEGTPPMSMRAEVQVYDSKGASASGDYSLDWASSSRWREEIRFGNYYRMRVGDQKGYWQKSEISYQPEVIFVLDNMLGLRGLLGVGGEHALGKIKNREKGSVRQNCTEVRRATRTERTMCFDASSGALVSVEFPTQESQFPPDISRIEYSAFTSISGKLVPHEIRAFSSDKVAAVVRVVTVAEVREEKPELFLVPVDAEFWTLCEGLQAPQPTFRGDLRYPASARSKREEGRVVLYAVIESDGTLSHLEIIHRATPDLEAGAVERVRRWRYKPAVCGQVPIRLQTSITVDFRLGP